MASEKSTLVIITSNLECEVGITSFARFLSTEVVCYNLSPAILSDKTRLFDEILKPFVDGCKDTFDLCFFGDFLLSTQDIFPVIENMKQVFLYAFDKNVYSYFKTQGQWVSCNSCEAGPLIFVASLIQEQHPFSGALNCAIKCNEKLIGLLEDRCFGKNVEKTQPLFTGLCNHKFNNNDATHEEKLYQVFCGHVKLEDVLKIGKQVYEMQVKMCENHVSKTARAGKLKGSATYVIVNNAVLMNVTHIILHKMYPEMDVTICTKLLHTKDGDKIYHSIRSWNDKFPAKDLIGMRGGGTDTQAGFTKKIDIQLDY